MKRREKKRARTGKVKLPASFTRLCKTLIAREYSAFLPSGKHETLKHAGAIMGHIFCDLDQLHEDYSKAQPTAQAREDFDKRRAWLAVNVGKAMYMSKTDAVEFLSGLLSELKRRKPRRGHGYAAVAEQVFLNHIAAATRCHTQREVADLVKSHLPPEIVERWNKNQEIAFYASIRMFCNRIGFTPARRGRPAKK